MKYPPCPNPPTSHVDEDVTLDLYPCYGIGDEPPESISHQSDIVGDTNVSIFNASSQPNAVCINSPEALEELAWPSWRSMNESDADSSIEPLPSSASIWINYTTKLTSEVEAIDASDVFDLVTAIGNVSCTSSEVGQVGSRVPPNTQTELSDAIHGIGSARSEWIPSDIEEQPLNRVLTLSEKITVSLLDAMNTRDRREVVSYVIQKPQRTLLTSFTTARKRLRRAFRRIWKKLQLR